MSAPIAFRARTRATKLAAFLSAALASSSVTPAPSLPAGSALPVTSCADDGSPGTLRSVMLSAPRGSTIDLTQLTCSTITLEQGAIDLSAAGNFEATVLGPGADRLAIDGNEQDTIFRASQIEIDGLTLTHGRGQSYGGCVQAYLSVVMRSSRVIACTAYGTGRAGGGGINAGYWASLYSTIVADNTVVSTSAAAVGGGVAAHYGYVAVVDSAISGNTAIGSPGRGGGVYSVGGMTFIRSTIDDNVADVGGGSYCQTMFLSSAWCDLQNSTISGNIAHERGGGLVARYAQATALYNSTIAYNSAESGHVGGLLLSQSSRTAITIQSSIIAKNTAGSTDLAADIDTDAGNFPQVIGGNDLFTTIGHVRPFPLIVDDPLLGPLTKNGGPTRTHALLSGSPAIDAGNNDGRHFATDQRGRARVSGAAADIGAFEVQTDAIFASGFD